MLRMNIIINRLVLYKINKLASSENSRMCRDGLGSITAKSHQPTIPVLNSKRKRTLKPRRWTAIPLISRTAGTRSTVRNPAGVKYHLITFLPSSANDSTNLLAMSPALSIRSRSHNHHPIRQCAQRPYSNGQDVDRLEVSYWVNSDRRGK